MKATTDKACKTYSFVPFRSFLVSSSNATRSPTALVSTGLQIYCQRLGMQIFYFFKHPPFYATLFTAYIHRAIVADIDTEKKYGTSRVKTYLTFIHWDT